MARNNIYTLILDESLNKKFQEMQRKFRKGEKIISQQASGNKLLVTTEILGESKNLLLDDLRAGRMPEFGERRG